MAGADLPLDPTPAIYMPTSVTSTVTGSRVLHRSKRNSLGDVSSTHGKETPLSSKSRHSSINFLHDGKSSIKRLPSLLFKTADRTKVASHGRSNSAPITELQATLQRASISTPPENSRLAGSTSGIDNNNDNSVGEKSNTESSEPVTKNHQETEVASVPFQPSSSSAPPIFTGTGSSRIPVASRHSRERDPLQVEGAHALSKEESSSHTSKDGGHECTDQAEDQARRHPPITAMSPSTHSVLAATLPLAQSKSQPPKVPEHSKVCLDELPKSKPSVQLASIPAIWRRSSQENRSKVLAPDHSARLEVASAHEASEDPSLRSLQCVGMAGLQELERSWASLFQMGGLGNAASSEDSRKRINLLRQVVLLQGPRALKDVNVCDVVWLEQHHHRGAGDKHHNIFGVHLTDLPKEALITSIIGGQRHQLPIIVFTLVEAVFRRGIATPGIFRLAGDSVSTDGLISAYNAHPLYGDRLDLDHESVFTLADLLKRFLRELPEPVLSISLWPLFVNICLSKVQADGRHMGEDRHMSTVKAIQILFRLLPPQNMSLLIYMIAFLFQLTLHPANRLTIESLSVIFGPPLLAPRPARISQEEQSRYIKRSQEGLFWLLNNWDDALSEGLMEEDWNNQDDRLRGDDKALQLDQTAIPDQLERRSLPQDNKNTPTGCTPAWDVPITNSCTPVEVLSAMPDHSAGRDGQGEALKPVNQSHERPEAILGEHAGIVPSEQAMILGPSSSMPVYRFSSTFGDAPPVKSSTPNLQNRDVMKAANDTGTEMLTGSASVGEKPCIAGEVFGSVAATQDDVISALRNEVEKRDNRIEALQAELHHIQSNLERTRDRAKLTTTGVQDKDLLIAALQSRLRQAEQFHLEVLENHKSDMEHIKREHYLQVHDLEAQLANSLDEHERTRDRLTNMKLFLEGRIRG